MQEYDASGDEKISLKEFLAVEKKRFTGSKAEWKRLSKQMKQWYNNVDSNNDGQVDPNEIIAEMYRY